MKKSIFLLIIFFLFIPSVFAFERYEVEFSDCVDGDTAKFVYNGEIETVRFLAIDTPETYGEDEYYGPEASEFTCNALKNAGSIELEFDSNSDERDKYDRLLAWIWIDDKLLQELIVENGYGEVAYLYGDYEWTERLQKSEKYAKTEELGMWSEGNDDLLIEIIYIVIAVILVGMKLYKRYLK